VLVLHAYLVSILARAPTTSKQDTGHHCLSLRTPAGGDQYQSLLCRICNQYPGLHGPPIDKTMVLLTDRKRLSSAPVPPRRISLTTHVLEGCQALVLKRGQ
jgi:hypothetical protein